MYGSRGPPCGCPGASVHSATPLLVTEANRVSAVPPDVDPLFDRLRAACPSFGQIDDGLRRDWHPDVAPPYIRIAALAWHLAARAERDGVTALGPVLAVVEDTLPVVDGYGRDLLVEGLVEDLQNACLQTNGAVALDDVRALLGPASRDAWDALMAFWHGSSKAAP